MRDFTPASSPCPSQCFNFGFDFFSEMLLLISRRRRHSVWPRRVSRFRPEWDCALPHRVYGAQHRHLSFRIFILISLFFFFFKTAWGQLWLWWGWGQKKKNVLGRDFRNALAFARIRTVRRPPLLCISIWERGELSVVPKSVCVTQVVSKTQPAAVKATVSKDCAFSRANAVLSNPNKSQPAPIFPRCSLYRDAQVIHNTPRGDGKIIYWGVKKWWRRGVSRRDEMEWTPRSDQGVHSAHICEDFPARCVGFCVLLRSAGWPNVRARVCIGARSRVEEKGDAGREENVQPSM